MEKRSESELTDGFEEIAKQERADIQSRGGVVVETREELLRHIHNALETNEQKTIFLGKISEELKQRIAQEAGDSSLFKNGKYAFGISYDNIGHIQKHFSEIEDIALALENSYKMLQEHESIEVIRGQGGYTKLKII